MIFVDTITTYPAEAIHDTRARRVGRNWCHMWCDGDLEELHAMALKIGMKRSWFQDHKILAHYDLVPSKRALAIANGAVEMPLRQWLKKNRSGRSDTQDSLTDPSS